MKIISIVVFFGAFICFTKLTSAKDVLSVKITSVQFSTGGIMHPINGLLVVHGIQSGSSVFKGLPFDQQNDPGNQSSVTYSTLAIDSYATVSPNFNATAFSLSSDKFDDKSLLVIELWNRITPEQKYYKAGLVGDVAYFKSLPKSVSHDIADQAGDIVGKVALEFE